MSISRLLPHENSQVGEPIPISLPDPRGPAYVDRTAAYRAVHFFGPHLHVPMREAADYLQSLERMLGAPPHVMSSHSEFSAQDARGELAWKVTIVLNIGHEAFPAR
ncbi:MAG: hypothetical protein J2P26_01640 [Nocardiopsaceae bacterium]|nr:hypothetical protein [Nocardiopsaceae bacterium]